MKFAKIVYWIAAIYGFLVLTPMYFLADRIAQDAPPALTHLEFYYGFIGIALLWQIAFAMIAGNPARYRPFMLLTILEKFIYTVPAIILYSQGRIAQSTLNVSLVDPIFGVLFIVAYFKTGKSDPATSRIGAPVTSH